MFIWQLKTLNNLIEMKKFKFYKMLHYKVRPPGDASKTYILEKKKKENMTKIENQTAVTFTGETIKLPSGAMT